MTELQNRAVHYIQKLPDNKLEGVLTYLLEIIENEEPPLDADWGALFPPLVDTKAWKFNREEANER